MLSCTHTGIHSRIDTHKGTQISIVMHTSIMPCTDTKAHAHTHTHTHTTAAN